MARSAVAHAPVRNRTLLLCEQCRRICGCAEPGRRACHACTSHNCPLLPAPGTRAGLCSHCTPATVHPPTENHHGAFV